MFHSARLQSVQALGDFQTALQRFRQDAARALDSVSMEARRAFDWLDERLALWQEERRRREDGVAHAKEELARRKMVKLFGREPDTSEQEKALRLAVARLREAEEKIEACRRWGPVSRRAADDYQGQARQLAAVLEADLPRSIALLGRRIEALDAYLTAAPPAPPVLPPRVEAEGGGTP